MPCHHPVVAIAETPAAVRFASGTIPYTLRRSPRARTLRVVIHPDRGVVVTVPTANRRGWADPAPHVDAFLRSREPWLRRHLAQQQAMRAAARSNGGLRDGARFRYQGTYHRLRIAVAPAAATRSSVALESGGPEPTLTVRLATRDARTVADVLDPWLRRRARVAVDREIARHATALGVTPTAVTLRDQRSRWGSASAHGRLSFSWRLILAPPEALETVVVHELSHLRILGHGPRFWAIVASRRPDHVAWRRWLHDHALELHQALDDG